MTYRYQTGNLREYGETIKDELKAYLYNRYHEWMEGLKMCDCAQTVAERAQVAYAELPEDGDVMRVKLDGPYAPAGMMPIKGESGRHYGRRQKGDSFLILRKDYISLSRMVIPFQDYDLPARSTPIPPPPPGV